MLKSFLNVGRDVGLRSFVMSAGRPSFCFGRTINISWLTKKYII